MTVDKSLQDILLNIEVVVGDGVHSLTELGQILYRLVNSVIIDIVGGRFGAEIEMIAHVQLDESLAVMAADHGLRCDPPGRELASALSLFPDRPIIDNTGLSGMFGFHLEWTPDPKPINRSDEAGVNSSPQR